MLALLVVACALTGLVSSVAVNGAVDRVALEAPLLAGRAVSAVSPRHRVVQLASAGLFAGAAGRIGFEWDLPAFLWLLAGLLTLACTDAEHLVLPRRIVYGVLAPVSVLLVISAAATGHWHELLVAGLCGVGWFVAFLSLHSANPRLLGFGDVRLAPLLGLALGWLGVRYVLLGFFAANLVGAVVGIALLATGRMSRQQPIPYGVFLAIGTVIAIFAGPQLLAPLQRL